MLAHLLTAMLLVASAAYAQQDDFNDNVADGWTPYNPIGVGIYTLSGGTYRIQTGPSPDPANFGPGRAGSLRTDVNYSDFFASVDIVNWDPTLDQAIGLMARLDDIGPGMTDGYAMTYQVADGDIDITWFRNENPNAPNGGSVIVAGNDAFPMVPGRSYRFQFMGMGSTLRARVYELPNLRVPVADITGTDTHYTSGICGLLNFDNSGGSGRTDATYDNYLALSAEPPTMTIVHTIFDDLWVFWPVTATGFVLQSTPSLLEPIIWTDICPPYTVSGDQFQHFGDPFNPTTLYYRLVQKTCPP